MEFEEFYNEIKELKQDLSEIQIKQFYDYMNLLLEWNEKMNLTAITEPKEVITKHFIDSMTILDYIKEGSKIVDVGTGAGFPGIPVKIGKNNIDVTLLDSLNKRLIFLNEVINKLELKNIRTTHSRVEDAGRNKEYREKFDIATSRAVANLSVLAEYMLPLVKVGGICICMKGPEVKEEIEESKKAIEVLGGEIENVYNFKLANTEMERNIIIIKKTKNTPKQYPRKSGTPSKEPIK